MKQKKLLIKYGDNKNLFYCLILKMKRSFTVEKAYKGNKKLKFTGGRYISENPASAVKKAFSKILIDINAKSKSKNSMVIYMKETTQGSTNKIYKYKVSKIFKESQIKIGDKTIIHKFVTKVVSMN
jgi:hypothetical protein